MQCHLALVAGAASVQRYAVLAVSPPLCRLDLPHPLSFQDGGITKHRDCSFHPEMKGGGGGPVGSGEIRESVWLLPRASGKDSKLDPLTTAMTLINRCLPNRLESAPIGQTSPRNMVPALGSGNLLDFDFISAESSRTSNSTSVLSDGSPSSSVALSNKYGRSYQKRRNSKDGRGYYESSTSGSQQSESDLGSAELQKQVSPQGMRARHRHRIVKPQMSANKVEDNGKMRVDALTPITENLHSEGDIEEMSLYIRRLPKGARGSTCGPQPPPKTSLPMDTYTRNRNKSHKYQSPHRSPDGSSNNSLTKSPRHITRFESPSGKELNKSSKSGGALTQQSYASMTHATSISAMRQLSDGAKKRESHPACKGPDFIKTMFNVHSQSPLVAHFLNQKGLRYDVGTNVVVQRTEVRNLPPYPFIFA
uniref:Micronuclear linker histone polyprotein-like n=1 Tax=Saccoglossus kowalevskii TaxID=10224 RepID=A0ABM0GMY7_SACKO|nr:PREDICTED: micronuclear linker histone polyprotein-like [Saccoglossus kowalevskii]